MKNRNVLLGITGSIAAYKACDLIGLFKRSGFDVKCVLTEEAEYFITPLTIETLSCNKVFCGMFERPEEKSPRHVSLGEWADVIVISPASMNIIGKLASGICDDLLTCAVFSSKAPVLIAPAMNDNMYKHSVTARNIAALKADGYHFAGPVKGMLACGKEGIGHIADVKDIFSAVRKLSDF